VPVLLAGCESFLSREQGYSLRVRRNDHDMRAEAGASRDSTTRESEASPAIDFALLTAIDVERRAVCEVFGLGAEHRVRRGSRVYWRGRLPLEGGEAYEIVVAQALDMANVDAALLTADALHDWQPGAALLIGIAASADPVKVKLGDIVVGSEVYYYERGKITPGGTRAEPTILVADATLWSNVRAAPDWDGSVPVGRPDETRDGPAVHMGVIASGEKVLADEGARDRIGSAHRKILAIEMEGYGFSRAVWQSSDHVRHLDIRGICDDGSPSKDDRWHAYAASAAAAFARHFLLDRPLAPRGRIDSGARPSRPRSIALRVLLTWAAPLLGTWIVYFYHREGKLDSVTLTGAALFWGLVALFSAPLWWRLQRARSRGAPPARSAGEGR
jgi:nucleoside phosphorylase